MGEKMIDYIDHHRTIIDNEIIKQIELLKIPSELKKSMLYSIQAGGKRLRPILLMASYEAYGNNRDITYSSAIALEMIHTYSLIHDDLPAMDNDDYRRGKLTNHKMFNEATAILAADALLTYSFEVIANDDLLNDSQKVFITRTLSKASGPKGMVAGQVLDMEAENTSVSIEKLKNIHSLKTGELFKFAIITGAYLGNATNNDINYLKKFAYYLGLIFQIQDDILDVTGDAQKLGKPVGSDAHNQKSTYPKLLGYEGAIAQRDDYVKQAKQALVQANANNPHLLSLTDLLAKRES